MYWNESQQAFKAVVIQPFNDLTVFAKKDHAKQYLPKDPAA